MTRECDNEWDEDIETRTMSKAARKVTIMRHDIISQNRTPFVCVVVVGAGKDIGGK